MTQHLWIIPVRLRLLVACASAALLFACATTTRTAPQSAAIENVRDTNWTLTSIDGVAPRAPAPTLTFGAQYRFSGQGGCNPFYGIYGNDNGRIAIRTVRAANEVCDGAVMDQERAYLDALRTAQQIDLRADGMLRVDGAQNSVMLFTPDSP